MLEIKKVNKPLMELLLWLLGKFHINYFSRLTDSNKIKKYYYVNVEKSLNMSSFKKN